MKCIRKRIFAIALCVCVSLSVPVKENKQVVYAESNENALPDEWNQKQEKIKELEKLQNMAVTAAHETEEMEQIAGYEAEANKLERSYQGDLEMGPQIDLLTDAGSTTENTDPNYAYLVSDNTITQGVIENVNEFRWYAFVLNEKSKVSILLQMVTSLDADLYLFSLNQETSSLELVGGSATEGVEVQEFYNGVLEPGTYFFSVAGYEGTGNFAFAYYESSADANYEINDSAGLASNVELSTNITGVIDHPNDWDYYKFTVVNPTILRYSISAPNGYSLGYAGSSGSAPVIIDGTMIKVRPGTYYFAVYSPNGAYSSDDAYTVCFKKIGEYADEDEAPFRAISEEAGIVFQTNISGTSCYVNGKPIDFSYEYSFNDSNVGGYQSYNITLSNREGVRCQIWNEDMQGPDVVYYHSSTRPYRKVESKNLLRLMFYADESVKFYRIMCRGTGAYQNNTLFVDPNYAIVLIDPDTGKLVDIAEFNYFYDFAMGSNHITYARQKDMKFNYNLYDYVN